MNATGRPDASRPISVTDLLRPLVSIPLVLALLVVLPAALPAQAARDCTVQRIIDGDTFVCADQERVRLLLVDTPEMQDEPLGERARVFLHERMPPGTEVTLEMDVQERDRYGRLLAHVRLPDGRTVNRLLAREGYAQIMVIPPNVDRVKGLRAAVDSARTEGAGLWARGGFGATAPDGSGPERPPRDRASGGISVGNRGEEGSSCAAAYPDVCVPPGPPDLDCGDVPHRDFPVEGADPHRFDGDGDGVGCEGP